MKKFITLAAAALAIFASCQPTVIDPVKDPALEIAPSTKTVGNAGGFVEVVVSSTDTWTLTGEAEWATVSATKGKDGDVVKFTVEPNATGFDRQAEYTFKLDGEAKISKKFLLSQTTSEAPVEYELKVVTEDVQCSYEEGCIEFVLETATGYRNLEVELPTGCDWAVNHIVVEGEAVNSALVYIDVTENKALDPRTITVIFKEGEAQVSTTLTQVAKEVLYTESKGYDVALEGGDVTVNVITNVEYTVESDATWCTVKSNQNNVLTLSVAAGTERRVANITLTQKDGALVHVFTVTQKTPALVNYAIDLQHNRAFPDFNGSATVNAMQGVTLEALVYARSFTNTLHTIMGIEGYLLLRVGDSGIPSNQLQCVLPYYRKYRTSTPTKQEAKISSANTKLDPEKWYHIALTIDGPAEGGSQKAVCYINGEVKGEYTLPSNTSSYTYMWNPWNLSQKHSNEPDGVRCFWFGYAYDGNRDWQGLMTEMRIWNRALSAEEINSENHFYQVDPKSEGLVHYWRCDEGEGDTVKDHVNGYNLSGELNVNNSKGDWQGDPGLVWAEVSLP